MSMLGMHVGAANANGLDRNQHFIRLWHRIRRIRKIPGRATHDRSAPSSRSSRYFAETAIYEQRLPRHIGGRVEQKKIAAP